MRALSVGAIAVFSGGCGAGPPASEPLAAGPPAATAATLPALQEHGLLFVELRDAHDAPLLALLDTGANASAIDPKLSAQLPAVASSTVVGTTGTVAAELVDLDGLHFGELALPRLRATRRDLGGLLAPKDRRVDMILGTDACQGRVLVLDFAAGTAALQPQPSPGLRSVPMRLDEGIPALPARLGGVDLELRVDTGASLFATDDVYVNVPPHAWRRVAAQTGAAPVAQLQGTGADGRSVQLPVYRVPAATIAGVDCASTFAIVQPAAGYFASPDALGFVSNNFLARLGHVEFDFAAQRFACSQ